MKYYLEITITENKTLNLYALWSHLYTQLHLALVEIKDVDEKVRIGFSFPEYRYDADANIGFLGAKCRLFAPDEAILTQLAISKWLDKLSEYVHITAISAVPAIVKGYAVYQKLGLKTNPQRQARRLAKRKNLSFDQALEMYADFEPAKCNFPYVQLKSLSSQQSFRLIIRKRQETGLKSGMFNTYGLSSSITVPEF